MKGGFVAELFFGDVDHAFVVEDQLGHFVDMHPFRMIVIAELFFVLMDIYKSEVGDAECTFYGVAVGFAEGAELFHVYAFDARELFQDTVSGLFEAFVGLEKAAHEAPFAFFRFEPALNEEEFDIGAIEAKNNAVNGDQHAGFARISIHI